MKHLCILLIRVYQWAIAPVKRLLCGGKGTCRYDPSCSQYAIRALQLHGFFKGSAIAGLRILRCHPWGGFGLDNVPLLIGWKHVMGFRLSNEEWSGHALATEGAVLVSKKGRFVAEGTTPAAALNTAQQGSRDFDGGVLFANCGCDEELQAELKDHEVTLKTVGSGEVDFENLRQ